MSQVAAYFSGIQAIRRVQVTRSLGIEPDATVMYCLPQITPLPAIGTLTLVHGGIGLSIPDMKVDMTRFTLSVSGHMLQVRLLDRRWRWRYSPISGRYNVRLADGTIDPDTQRTPRELAALLFEAMHETGYDVSALPNEGYPEADWDEERADLILHALCEERGCDIALGVDNTAYIVRLGVGAAPLADSDAMTPSLAVDPPEGPDVLSLICGENIYQSALKCEAVGLDTDGSVKPIDELSYKPAAGWSNIADEQFFEQLAEEGMDRNAISLARKTVFRWYQVKSQADGSNTVPCFGDLPDKSWILPLNDFVLEQYETPFASGMQRKPYRVYGHFIVLSDPPMFESTQTIGHGQRSLYDGTSSLDKERGIVRFPRPMIQHDSQGGVLPADIYLETSYSVRDPITRTYARERFDRSITGGNLLREVVRNDDLTVFCRAKYNDPLSWYGWDVETNYPDVVLAANDILDGLAARYQVATSGAIVYRGLKPVAPNGVVRQIAWSVSDQSGANTVVSLNMETAVGPPRARERRRRRIIETAADSRRFVRTVRAMSDKGLAR